MPDHSQTFRGNGSAGDPKPQSFFKACRANIIGMAGLTEEQKMEWFELKLEAASEAEEWYEALDSQYKKSMIRIKPEFDKRSQRKCCHGVREVGSQMLRMSTGVDDTNKVLVPMIVKRQIPSVLRKFMKAPATFAELATSPSSRSNTLAEKLEKKKGESAGGLHRPAGQHPDAACASARQTTSSACTTTEQRPG
ncbi:hypothetical protein FIBSPDRAFT_968538 [Athelia psychrophila]|uniref:Uncharacterized protein n=1 Tax=Athelia psychrophila TaxID=1759441 RepID=A0A167UI11_9AGAM|nr:hypothetical protein FIBSPDRAFT_968538 [Fibularhizoctonia sp. CBS 109695]